MFSRTPLVLITTLTLALVLTGCTSSKPSTTSRPSSSSSEKAETTDGRVIDVTAENMAFSPKEIRVKQGETITISFTSKDSLHNWNLDEFNVSTNTVSTNQSDSVTFTPNTAGTFEFYCGVGNHRQQGLVGTLIVE